MRAPDSVANYTVDDLPDEVIEFILSFLPPYKDLHDCMRVCKRWRSRVLNVARTKRRQLLKSLSEFDVRWEAVDPSEGAPTIAKRYSHSAVVHGDSMYVFGGCTNSMTTFNDLWRLDLSRRQWIRPLATGIYPTPKACSSLVCYKDSLILFGGWAYPCSYPFHQSYQLFNELHEYSIPENRWSFVHVYRDGDIGINSPPPMAGHSVSVHGRHMIVFGGMYGSESSGPLIKTNDVWQLDLETWTWLLIETAGEKPRERYGHSQTAIDDDHALIMGGCGGPNGLYHDVWLLSMKGREWTWRQLNVKGTEWAPPDMWCHPSCRVGQHIVVLNRARHDRQSCWRPPAGPPDGRPVPPRQRRADRDENVNGRRGTLRPSIRQPQQEQPAQVAEQIPERPSTSRPIASLEGGPRLAAFGTSFTHRPARASAARNRERQLEMLRRMEDQIRDKQQRTAPSTPERPRSRPKRNALGLYLLDISCVLDPEPCVTWVKPKPTRPATGPEETLWYTLVQGKAELIMFGGIQKDDNSFNVLLGNLDPSAGSTRVSNSLHFISAPLDVI